MSGNATRPMTSPNALADGTTLRLAIQAWIRDDAPLAAKLNLLPKHVDELVARIEAALQSAAYYISLSAEEAAQAVATPGAIERVPPAEPTLFEILYLYYSKHFGPSEAETLAHKYKDEVIRLSTPTAPVVTEEAVEKACAILCAEVNDISKDHARDIVGTIFEAAAPHTRAAPVVPEGWRPIETAPKGTDDGTSDRPRILLFPDSWGRPVFGKWNDDRYSTKPRPYWQIEGQSISLSRVADPTHWMFATAPTPPSQGEQ